jgi:hypothetical protein
MALAAIGIGDRLTCELLNFEHRHQPPPRSRASDTDFRQFLRLCEPSANQSRGHHCIRRLGAVPGTDHRDFRDSRPPPDSHRLRRLLLFLVATSPSGTFYRLCDSADNLPCYRGLHLRSLTRIESQPDAAEGSTSKCPHQGPASSAVRATAMPTCEVLSSSLQI